MINKLKILFIGLCFGLSLCGCTSIDVQPTPSETVKLIVDPTLLEPIPPLIYLK